MSKLSPSMRSSSVRISLFLLWALLSLSLTSPVARLQRRNRAEPSSVELQLSNNLAAPNGTITAIPIVRDASGIIIEDPNFQFLINVSPNGIVVGNVPVVKGRTIRFPKVVKQLINPHPDLDPEGEFADANPADPNYGIETGGFYRVTATLNGTSLSASANVTVLPTGTANITVRTKQYADELTGALGTMTSALNSYDGPAIEAARVHLQAIAANTDNSHEILSVNHLLAPPNGYPVTPAQLIAAGFMPAADDPRLAPLIIAMQNVIISGRMRIESLDPARLTRRDVLDVWAIVRSYEALLHEFTALQVSPLGVIQQSDKLNDLITSDNIRLLDSIKLKSLALAATVHAGAKANATDNAWLSPKLVPAVFSAVTNLTAFAQANILTGTIAAANSMANIIGARHINSASRGGLLLEYLGASSSQVNVCPHYQNTFIGGSGLTSNPNKIKILLIGCVNSSAITNLLLLRLGQVRDIKGGFQLIHKIISNARALWGGQIAAVVHPADYVIEDYLWDYTVYYINGWPRVNQGQLPCVGTIVVFNMENATVAAANSNFLPHCP